LGIENLKRILPNLMDWATEDGEDYRDLNELYGQVLTQFGRYMRHVRTNIGGVYEMRKRADEDGVIFTPVSREKQKEAHDFMQKQLFRTPMWMIDKDIINRIENSGTVSRIASLQLGSLRAMLAEDRLLRMIENETLNGAQAYSPLDYLADMNNGIWSELSSGATIDTYRRNLQRAHIGELGKLMNSENARYDMTDIKAIARMSLIQLQQKLSSSRATSTGLKAAHIEDSIARIENILDPD